MDIKALEKRTVRRTKMVFALKISHLQVQGSPLLVHTLDISHSGAKIGALRECIQPGSILLMQYRHHRAQCCVMWSREVAVREIQIGIEFLSQCGQFWEVDLDQGCAGVWLTASER
jgi:PilZ domain